jgi:glucokinase
MTVIGIDLGGTKLAGAVFDQDGQILARETTAIDGRTGHDVATLLLERLQDLRQRVPASDAPTAVGVSVPGIYRAQRGTVWAPNIAGWDDFPLRDVLRDALGRDMDVVIDSDRAAYILGETWRGAARGARDAIFLAVGTGIGAGILVNGAILRGSGDVAGAIGWLALERPYHPRWKACGCFEHQASGPGLVRVARELLDGGDPSDGGDGGDGGDAYDGELRRIRPDDLSTAAIFSAHARGDALATRVVDNAIELWGMAAANLVSLFNPETIIFGGGVFGPAAKFIDRIQDEAERWAQPIAVRQVRFACTTLGGDAGLYGAGRLTLT